MPDRFDLDDLLGGLADSESPGMAQHTRSFLVLMTVKTALEKLCATRAARAHALPVTEHAALLALRGHDPTLAARAEATL